MIIKCDECGVGFNKPPFHIKRNKNHFCSDNCFCSWKSKNKRMENNPNWKGGRYVTSAGYVMVYLPGHIRQNNWGYVYEHIVVAEKKYGKSTKGYIVHHLNGCRNDNREENLVIVKRRDHEGNTFAKLLQNRIMELEGNNLKLMRRVADMGM